MSNSPKEKPWQMEVAEIVNDQVEKLLRAHKEALASPLSSEKQHKTAQEIADCPNCRKEYKVDEFEDKIKSKTREEWIKALKDRGPLEYECKECGTGESEEEAKNGECPTCHGKLARRRN